MTSETKTLLPIQSPAHAGAHLLPALLTEAGPHAEERFFEFIHRRDSQSQHAARFYAGGVRIFCTGVKRVI
jgi:hypothetical protein